MGAAVLTAQSAAGYRAQALAAAKSQKWSEAVELYRKAIELDPKDAASHFNLGSILLTGLHVKDALAELKNADQLRPGDPAIQCSLARALLQNGLPADAAAQFRKCLPPRPKDAEGRYYFGIALGQEG